MIKSIVFAHLLFLAACSEAARDAEPAPDSSPTLQPEVTVQLPALDSGATTLLPTDQADASFKDFRTRALAALAARDTAFLFGILAPEIRNSFGGDDGVTGFKRIWNMSSPNTQVWTALTRILEMGGTLKDSTFTAPYVFALWPDAVDPFENVAVIKENAPLRSTPDRAAEPAGTASYSLLKVKKWQGVGENSVAADSTWAQVLTPKGDSMWIAGKDVYSPVSWRAIFQKRSGKWLMIFLAAGD